jgi:hypothetical protein
MSKKKIFFIIIAVVVFLALANNAEKKEQEENNVPVPVEVTAPTSRSFYMGFTQWPPEFTVDGIVGNFEKVNRYGDLNVYHQLGGVPWVEAEQGTLPARIKKDWTDLKAFFSGNKPTYVGFSPLSSTDRSGLAEYSNEKSDNEVLPSDWKNLKFNDPRVIKAYTSYVDQGIQFFNPRYVALNIEGNLLFAKNAGAFDEFVEFNKEVYTALKAKYPYITFLSIAQVEHLNGVASDAKGKEEELAAMKKLAQYSDAIGLSVYPYTAGQETIDVTYFDAALSLGKPLAVTESGFNSQKVKIGFTSLVGSREGQVAFEKVLLETANKNNFLFVVNWAATDYSKLIATLPGAVRNAAKIWEFTGMYDSEGKEKPALTVWKAYFNAPKR